ncbi:uncharacterized protein LOC117102686 [Anneissia japonica]|uniref:uncharacterized protein LOC117102686 n=1 Tax=Anneissia japonica TaxID=1529436 RepID=UPI0014259A31|nr:uncharacterized protein LOC117102686 [Anneissia japonica]
MKKNVMRWSGHTPGDWFEQNACSAYNASEREEQKYQILQLLQQKIIPMEIQARGPEALKAFNEALQEGETEVYQARTLFLGLERVGKSSTIDSFLRKPFNPDKHITDAIATTKVCTQDLQNELEWKETANDHSGVAEIYNKGLADAITMKISKNIDTKETNTTEVNLLSKEIKEEEKINVEDKHKPEIKRKENLQIPSVEQVPENIASEVEERMKSIKFTREGTNGWQKSGSGLIISIWDFGGQPIYHVIQRIFMASLAVACVVFNLNDDLDAPANVRDPTTGEMYKHRMTHLQFILYWIRSVFMNSRESKLDDKQLSPPVLLIGTHLDKLEGNEEQRKNKAEGIFSKIHSALAGKPYEAMVFSTMYAIDNSVPFSKSSASEIMSQILTFTKKMVRRLPLKWLLVQQKIQKLKKKHIYLPTNEVIALLDRCEVKRDAHRVLLEYLHDVGELLYFPDDKALKDVIVLDLMQIVDMFKTVITVINPKLQEPLLKEAWRKLDSGILEELLLKHLWQKFNLTDETFDFFIHLMQKFGLVCERKISKTERIFYVLSRLKPEHVDSLPPEDYGKRAVSIFHDFGGYLPDDLFQRGVTKFIEKFQVEDSEPKLAYEHVELGIHEHHHVILNVATIKHRRMFQMTIIRRKILNTDAEEDEPSPSVCKEVLRFVEAELRLFCQSGARGVELTRYIPCVCTNHAYYHQPVS